MRAVGLGIGFGWLQGESMITLGEFERRTGCGGGCAMLDGQHDAISLVAAKVEVEFLPAWNSDDQRRASPARTAPPPSGMVDDGHGDGMTPLQFAQEGEQWGDLAADILIDTVQPDEGIEHEQARLQPGDGLVRRVRSAHWEYQAAGWVR